MAVYVDPLMDYGWRLGPSCHMMADSDEELHEMAAKIGMRRSWHQPRPPHSVSHYDLVKSRRDRAVRLGAVEVDLGFRPEREIPPCKYCGRLSTVCRDEPCEQRKQMRKSWGWV